MTGGPRIHGLRAFAGAAFLFVYLPIVVMVLFSFNASAVAVWPMKGLTMHWYGDLFRDDAIRSAFLLSLRIAALATVVAGILGTLLAYAAHRLRFPGKWLLQRLVLLPLVVPGVVTGIALLTVFSELKLTLSASTILLGHITFLVAVFFTTVFARLQGLGVGIERAAMDLGASEMRAFFAVILPNLKLTLLGAAVIAFTLSFDEIAVTYFLTGTQNTVPMLIYAKLRTGLTPTVNALATVSLLITLVPIVIGAVVANRVVRRRTNGVSA